tara:strand:- start:3463 stop:4284 length:822 start_codon:yes stop_codon:yes gene_type:complete
MTELKLSNIIKKRCSLGEGLACSDYGKIAWVDINNNKIFVKGTGSLNTYDINVKASVIFRIEEEFLEFGSDAGIYALNFNNRKIDLIAEIPKEVNSALLRSNDGCLIEDVYFLSFMSRDNPENNKGSIYSFNGQKWSMLDSDIWIPNSFIEIRKYSLLISDSLQKVIWQYKFNEDYTLKSKEIWTTFEYGNPDGGCMIGDKILIAVWDHNRLAVFDKAGILLKDFNLPILRPTNCKYCEYSNKLWITSACEGLTETQKRLYPDSGYTFIYEVQ